MLLKELGITQPLLPQNLPLFLILFSVFLRTEIMRFEVLFWSNPLNEEGLGASVSASGIEVKNGGQFISRFPPSPNGRSIMCHSQYFFNLGNRSDTGKALQWVCHSGGN